MIDPTIRIFMAEDDQDDVHQVQRHFKDHDLASNLSIFENGSHLIDALNERHPKPDIILLDLNMPIFDGYQVLDHIAGSELSKIPIFILNSGEAHLSILKKKRLQVAGYLQKPVELGELEAVCLNNGLSHLIENNK